MYVRVHDKLKECVKRSVEVKKENLLDAYIVCLKNPIMYITFPCNEFSFNLQIQFPTSAWASVPKKTHEKLGGFK